MKFRTRLKSLAGRTLRYGGLLALIGLIALAAISPWRHPTLTYDGDRLYGQVASRYGAIDIFLALSSTSHDKLPGFFEPLLKIEKSRTPRWNWRYRRTSLPVRNLDLEFIVYTIPYWIPVSIIALPTSLIWWVWYRRRRRERIGHCRKCNYDLRGLPTPTCPECGREQAPPAGSKPEAEPEASEP